MARAITVVLYFLLTLAAPSFAASSGVLTDQAGISAPDSEQRSDSASAAPGEEKSVASGLYMDGAWLATFGPNYSTVTINLPHIYNSSFAQTGTLRLSFWAVTSFAGRGIGFSGYRLANFATFSPLPAGYYYYDIVRSGPMVVPPNGTYWLVLALEEYGPAYCSSADGFCLVDSTVSDTTRTFGPTSTTLTVRLPGTGSGSVFVSANSSSCSSTCALSVASNSVVTLTATPSAGSAFAGWTGACSGSSTSCQVSMISARTAAAWFNSVPSSAAVTQMVTHYYAALLRRGADPAGQSFWESEAQRLSQQGASVNEVWFAMAMSFLSSAEYLSQNRGDSDYVTDLYNTFFNRPPDSSGLPYWFGQIQSGMPREVVLASFMFSPEFAAFTSGMFGNVSARAEVNTVLDFYRGVLSRLPDTGGLNYWVQQFRTAQCQGSGAVYTQVDGISGQFLSGSEYAQRLRTNAQFVGDLYNGFLRRGGDVQGVQYWISQLSLGLKTREQLRQAFLSSPEFSARASAIVSQGCVN